MANIIEYVREMWNTPFREQAFNAVDSLVLSQLSYLKFDGIVPGTEDDLPAISLRDLYANPLSRTMFLTTRDGKKNEQLLSELTRSQRFGGMGLNYYVNEVDISQEKQFSAIAVSLEDGSTFIAFRGTDETIIGWKEDFNMAFTSPVPAQTRGVDYLHAVAHSTTGHLRIGGHSKGGNIAVYSAMRCAAPIRNRITDIYSLDGPGFRNEIFQHDAYAQIRERIHKYLPHSAVIGMLLQSQEDYRVVESRRFWILQHDPYSWEIENVDFHYADAVKKSTVFMNETLNKWLSNIDDRQREKFVDTFYTVIRSTDADTLTDLTGSLRKNAIAMLGAAIDVDSETKIFVLKAVYLFVVIAAKDMTKNQLKRFRDRVRRFDRKNRPSIDD